MKKLLSIVLALSLCLTAMMGCFVVSAETVETQATITVGDVKTNPGKDVAIKVTGANFTDVCAAELEIALPEEFTLKSIYNGENELVNEEDNAPYYVVNNNVIKTVEIYNFTGGDETIATTDFELTINATVAADAECKDYTVDAEIAGANIDEQWLGITVTDGTVTVEEEVVEPEHPVSLELYAGGALVETIGYDSLAEALSVTYDYACSKEPVSGDWYDPHVVLNADVALDADAEVVAYTTLHLGDYTINEGDYEIVIAGSGKIEANYDVTLFDGDPFVVESVSDSVYTYTTNTQLELNSKALELSDRIYIKMNSKVSTSYTGTIEYGFQYYKSIDPTNVYTVAQADLESVTSSKLTANTDGIPAKEMGVAVVAKFYAKTTVDGVDYYAYSNTISYSIVTYATNMLPTANETTKNLLVDMLNYGTYAQVYFDYDVENPANAILDDSDKVLPEDISSALVSSFEINQLEDSPATHYVKSQALELLDAINVIYTMNTTSTENTYKMCVWTKAEYEAFVAQANGDEQALYDLLVLENCTNVLDIEDGKFYVSDIPAKKFANTIVTRSVTIDSTGNAIYDWAWSYSPIQYCINTIEKNENANLVNLCKALALYSESARVYFNNYEIDS